LFEQEGRELPEVILRGRKNGDGYTETEKKLGRIWGLVLGLAEINIYDDFFELGRHSLLAARLEAELEKRDMLVDGVDVYRYKNIKDMADFFECSSDEKPNRQEEVFITIQSNIIPEDEPHSENVEKNTVVPSGGSIVLENIQPFNDVYYISCFYNSFFPVLTYFNKSIKPFLIKAEYKLQSQNITGAIKASIDGGNPVIIWVDCYYDALRIDTYQKRHLSHTWLIFGYDDDNQCCHIVEHSRSDNLSYEKRVISYWDVVNSYHGYLDRFQKESTDPSFYTFCLSDAAKSTPSDGEYIEKYMENTASRSSEIAEEIYGLETFVNEAGDFLMNETSMQAQAEKIMNILTSIINAKQVERYIFAQLFGEESEITKLMGEITEYWNDARKPISRYVFSKIYKNKAMEKSAECFKKIYTLEHRMNMEYLCHQNKEEY
jgi:hypothetical protein